jgi:hypothetical protein
LKRIKSDGSILHESNTSMSGSGHCHNEPLNAAQTDINNGLEFSNSEPDSMYDHEISSVHEIGVSNLRSVPFIYNSALLTAVTSRWCGGVSIKKYSLFVTASALSKFVLGILPQSLVHFISEVMNLNMAMILAIQTFWILNGFQLQATQVMEGEFCFSVFQSLFYLPSLMHKYNHDPSTKRKKNNLSWVMKY